MNHRFLLFFVFTMFQIGLSAQGNFDYTVQLTPKIISNLPGLQSFAFAQHDGKWLLIGGRKDGVHARQPFAAFPQASNNTSIYVYDTQTQQVWSASLNSLPTGIKEQLQSTNMNFFQNEDTLVIIGGYAFSLTSNDHITFPYLTTISVSGLIQAIVNGDSINSYFKQISDPMFAVTGGQLGCIKDTFYLVGGQKFMGRYNPMGNPTYTQTYITKIQKFTLDNSGTQVSVNNYSSVNDSTHLRRRDYNLLPQIFPDGTEGFTISSGVFQKTTDLPFLYPVDIKNGNYTPVTSFNQYLSNYHSAKVCIFDSVHNNMHSIFFGGMSQYYYQNGMIVQDNQVPFVKTISRLTRLSDGSLHEYQLPTDMPGLKGAGAEFIPNHLLDYTKTEILKLSELSGDSILIGHIYGGISSPTLNPFVANQTNTTIADNTIYEVRLVKIPPVGVVEIDGRNPYDFMIYPNPANTTFNISYELKDLVDVRYKISTTEGKIIEEGGIQNSQIGKNTTHITPNNLGNSQTVVLSLIFDNSFTVSKKVYLLKN